MTRTLAEVVAALPPGRPERIAARTAAVMLRHHRHPATVRADARAWRAKQRAASLAPLSDKVVYPRKLVDAPPPPKKGRGK